ADAGDALAPPSFEDLLAIADRYELQGAQTGRHNKAFFVARTTANALRAYAKKYADELTLDDANLGYFQSVSAMREHHADALMWEIVTWDRSFPHPTIPQQWLADIFAEVDRRDSEDADWYKRASEAEREGKPQATATKPKTPMPDWSKVSP